ncbi:sensor histidine kinase [Luteococcus sp. Sow4_B9]|uniref:sensor histidine kinase n=1 Tax=Luteococcus sp. Sow4_B9 TaxID=3438792 RepID=UPI003F9C6E81
MSHSPRDDLRPRRAVSAGLRALGLLSWLCSVLFGVMPLYGQPSLSGRAPHLGFTLLAAYFALSLVCLLRPVGPRMLAATSLPLVTAVALMNYWRFGLDPIALWTPGSWAIPLLVAAIANLPRNLYRMGALAVVILLAVCEAIASWLSWLPVSAFQIAPVVLMWPPLLSVVLIGEGLMGLVWDQERTSAAQQHARAQLADEQAEARARAEAGRLLHDHVLHALHALNTPGSTISAEMVRAECSTAVEAMTAPTREGETTRVEQLLSRDPALVQSGAQLVGRSEPVPTHVAEALQAAAHEALRNVSRHAQAEHCQVVVAQLGRQCTVSIIDDGQGFDPHNLPDGRLGVRRSVLERLDDIGGQADVRSTPGQGTSVVLRWPRNAQTRNPGILEEPSDKVRTALATAALPGLLAGLLMSVVMAPHTSSPGLALLAGATLAGLGFFHAARLRERALEPVRAAVVMLATLGVWGLNIAVVPSDPATVHQLWVLWLGTTVVQLVALSGSLRRGLLVSAIWSAAVFVSMQLRFDLMAHWVALGTTLMAVLWQLLAVLVGMAVARRITSHEHDAAADTTHVRAATAHLQVDNRMDHFWSHRVTTEALPLLRDLAEGIAHPDDPMVRQKALRLEVALRDELRLGPSHGPLLELLGLRRRQGWAIQVALSGDDSEAGLMGVMALLELLGPPHRDGQMITLSTRGTTGSAVVLEATQSQWIGWRETTAVRGGSVEIDPDFVRLSYQTASQETGPAEGAAKLLVA